VSNRGLTPLPKRLNGCTGGNQFKVDIVYLLVIYFWMLEFLVGFLERFWFVDVLLESPLRLLLQEEFWNV